MNKIHRKLFNLHFFRLSILLLGIPFSLQIYSADLKDGLKGMRIGMTKAETFSILKKEEEKAGSFFAPYCSSDNIGSGEECRTIISKLTYGNMPLMGWILNFDKHNRLEGLRVLLSKEGCGIKDDTAHPKQQFEVLSKSLNEHYGPPNGSMNNSIVWIDSKIQAGLILALYSEELSGIRYPDCPVATVYLVTEERINRLNSLNKKNQARERDL